MDVKIGMPVRSGDGQHLGHVESLEADGFRVRGALATWSEIIGVRGGAIWVATHRPELEQLAKAAPRR